VSDIRTSREFTIELGRGDQHKLTPHSLPLSVRGWEEAWAAFMTLRIDVGVGKLGLEWLLKWR